MVRRSGTIAEEGVMVVEEEGEGEEEKQKRRKGPKPPPLQALLPSP